jgi:hypothetical protein
VLVLKIEHAIGHLGNKRERGLGRAAEVGLQGGGYRCTGNSTLTGCRRWCGLEQNSSKMFAQGTHGSFLLSSSFPKPISKRDHCRVQVLERSMEWRGGDQFKIK